MKIQIIPVSVGLNTMADLVEFQILSFDLSPTDGINANAKFYTAETKTAPEIEVANVPFNISQEIYNKWGSSDTYIIDECLILLNLTKAPTNGKATAKPKAGK